MKRCFHFRAPLETFSRGGEPPDARSPSSNMGEIVSGEYKGLSDGLGGALEEEEFLFPIF